MVNRPLLPDSVENPPEPEFQIRVSRGLPQWLAEQGTSLAFTNPPFKLFFLGLKPDGQLSVYERTFMRCLGLASADTRTLYVSSRFQIWRLESPAQLGPLAEGGYDRLFVPRGVYTTGMVGTHDIAVEDDGRVLFVNTRYGCIATVSDEYSFVPLWHPPFLPGPLPGDRCHLNGVALRDGRAAYATAISETAEFDSWRDHRRSGGVAIDIGTGEIVARGLSMPHSPRFYRDRLWVANAGTGELGYVDMSTQRFEPVAFCPGFLRGLCFVGDYAVIGSSKPREGDIYSGLELDERLARIGQEPRLGLFIVDLRTGEVAHWFFIEGNVRELYDVMPLPGVRQPMALGIMTDEIEKSIWFDAGNLVI